MPILPLLLSLFTLFFRQSSVSFLLTLNLTLAVYDAVNLVCQNGSGRSRALVVDFGYLVLRILFFCQVLGAVKMAVWQWAL